MTSEQFFSHVTIELNSFFKSNGFNGSNNFWSKKIGIVNQLVELQKSTWSTSYYLNIGFIIDPKEVVKKKISSHKWHYTCRFEKLAGWDNAKRDFYFGASEEMSEEDILTNLQAIVTEFEASVFPTLDKICDKDYFKTNPNLNPLEKVWFLQNIKSDQLRELIDLA